MSVYFLRYQSLIKIGFSDNLPTRLTNLISSIPGDVQFVGHMPGGREVESYLHEKFSGHRFNGEWFVECDAIRLFALHALDPNRPIRPLELAPSRVIEDRAETERWSRELRAFASAKWPDIGHVERVEKLASELRWKRSRAKALYYAEKKTRLRPTEVRELERAIARLGSLDSAMADPCTTEDI